MQKKVFVSALKPTGRLHIGNYFGAMRQFLEYQESFEGYIFAANYHAITSLQEREELHRLTEDVIIDHLAIGLDPEKVTLYLQSDVPEVTELAWIFSCITTMPQLMRAHAFKDAEAKNKELNVGVFTYPLLMAADILIQNPDIVPVGADQKQHVEMARDIAEKFNRIYGETFTLPEPKIKEGVSIVPGIDGQKMSKSYGNTIELFASDNDIKNQVMCIVTDSKDVAEAKNPEECNVFALHKIFSEHELPELKRRYVEGGIGYKESKEILAKNMIEFIAPLREKREKILADSSFVDEVLHAGAKKARARAVPMMEDIRKKVGLA